MNRLVPNLAGTWTYRSFRNNPIPVSTPEQAQQLIFGEGLLEIDIANEAEGFRATLSFGDEAVMDLTGSFIPALHSAPVTISAKGHGRAGGPIADYHYDYVFFTVPAWPEAIEQRDALVGTVLRAQDHGTAKKGVTASTITVRR